MLAQCENGESKLWIKRGEVYPEFIEGTLSRGTFFRMAGKEIDFDSVFWSRQLEDVCTDPDKFSGIIWLQKTLNGQIYAGKVETPINGESFEKLSLPEVGGDSGVNIDLRVERRKDGFTVVIGLWKDGERNLYVLTEETPMSGRYIPSHQPFNPYHQGHVKPQYRIGVSSPSL